MSKLRTALEAALMDDPDDLAAHMAWADHLAEQGDPRGEFAQVQLALEDAKLRPARRKELQAREAELLDGHEAEWLPGLVGDPPSVRAWRRGWLDEIGLLSFDAPLADALARCPAAPARCAGSPYSPRPMPGQAGHCSPFSGRPRSYARSEPCASARLLRSVRPALAAWPTSWRGRRPLLPTCSACRGATRNWRSCASRPTASISPSSSRSACPD